MSGRFSTVIKAKINKLLDRAEDPSETLEYSYQKQMELLQNVKKGIADVVTSKKRLQLQQQKLEQQVVKLDTQARQALAQNREDLARVALERKQFAQGELQSLDGQVQELESQQQQLVAKEQTLRTRIGQVGLRNSLLVAIAPTATIASIAGCFECVEPQVSNVFKRETLSGEFLQINTYLVRELKA